MMSDAALHIHVEASARNRGDGVAVETTEGWCMTDLCAAPARPHGTRPVRVPAAHAHVVDR